jgi:hypothetical protein
MSKTLLTLILVFSAFLMVTGQGKHPKTGFQFAALASFDQYLLTEKAPDGTLLSFRSAERFPDDYNLGYQFGFISKKKTWHQSYLNLIYFPEFERTYTEYSLDDGTWLPLVQPRNQNMDIYLVEVGKTFKLNLFYHRLYLSFGGGASGGIIRWPDYQGENKDLFFFSGQIYPSAGVELMLFNGLGLFAEMRYHVGLSETVSLIEDGGEWEWNYSLHQKEIKAGITIYFPSGS